ncbi:hypothetical protein [Rhodovulum sulfidophilum]|uniref:hypothetical protein n=1 Tax=Rhodovulum sulfidophilum TaxID=35806 RepID=UPI0015BF92BB|nr:hypothetical protein [Rhodovulum sulfidophilum]MBL3554304.1 hypothetical protein [Rhodovulum sulfidophilum]
MTRTGTGFDTARQAPEMVSVIASSKQGIVRSRPASREILGLRRPNAPDTGVALAGIVDGQPPV